MNGGLSAPLTHIIVAGSITIHTTAVEELHTNVISEYPASCGERLSGALPVDLLSGKNHSI
jgi:hypothetical protein